MADPARTTGGRGDVAASTVVGVDLAAEPARTAIALIRWDAAGAEVTRVVVGADDEDIAAAAADASHIGIDCAFGWPDDFVAFLRAHQAGAGPPDPREGGMPWRRRLAYRETDRWVHRYCGRWPLSVATDRLGLTAMRCAEVLGALERAGIDVDRAGHGRVFEVYPAAGLASWGLTTRGYRTEATARDELVTKLHAAAPWLRLNGHRAGLVASADALDAVLAALLTRAAALGHYVAAPPDLVERARREGWVVIPTIDLHGLAPPPR